MILTNGGEFVNASCFLNIGANGEYAGKMILVFRDWLEKNYQVPKRIKSGDKRTKPLAENREAEAYYDNGQLKSRATYKNGKINGLCEVWYDNGQLKLIATYKDYNLNGLCETWHGNGQQWSRANYKDDKLDGLREAWYSDGKLEESATYKDGVKQ